MFQLSDDIDLGPFIIKPSGFHLSCGQTININVILLRNLSCFYYYTLTSQVTFQPKDKTKYVSEIKLACDNGQVKSFTLEGNPNNTIPLILMLIL
jgi:hypothetical protein